MSINYHFINQNLKRQDFYIYRKDAEDCSFDNNSQIEEPNEFTASEKISFNGDMTKISKKACFPFRVGDDKVKGRYDKVSFVVAFCSLI